MRVLVTGGAGYVGSLLVPKLAEDGHDVIVFDRFLFRDDVFREYINDRRLAIIRGDVCDNGRVSWAMRGVEAVIHMACIANDPTLDLAPELGRQINRDAFVPLVHAARKAGVKRFIYASSSSVYGIKPDLATEYMTCEPLTDYSRYKYECELALAEEKGDMVTVVLRPATLCGWSPRLRLDTVPNLFVAQAVCNGEITLFGGEQYRAMLDVRDMVKLYQMMLKLPDEAIDGKTWNVVRQNITMAGMADKVAALVPECKHISRTATADLRSYAISGRKLLMDIHWKPSRFIGRAIQDLATRIRNGSVPAPITNDIYYNVRRVGRLYA